MEDEEGELTQLKTLYDELWRDARTMIKDMYRSIFVYLFAGFIALAFSIIMIGTAISDWGKITSGNATSLTYFYAAVETPGSVVMIAFGVALLYWYYKLRNRYSKLIKMEKAIED